MEQLTKNQAVATSQEAVQNQNEPQLRDENAHNDKSVHGVLNPTYQAGLRRDAVQPDIEAEDRKSGSAGMPRPISYAVFCLKKKNQTRLSRPLASTVFVECVFSPECLVQWDIPFSCSDKGTSGIAAVSC